MPNIRAIAIRYTGPSAKIGLPLDGTAPDAQAIHGNEAAGDDRHPGFMVESAPILARNGEHAVLCGIESEVDISGPALAGSPKANFQEMKSDFGFIPHSVNGQRKLWPPPTGQPRSKKLHQTNDPVTLLQAYRDVVALIEAISPSADGVIAGCGAEARNAFLDRELEKKCQDLFFGRALQSGRTAGCAILPGMGGLTDLLARQI
jgi:hypothetical protein